MELGQLLRHNRGLDAIDMQNYQVALFDNILEEAERVYRNANQEHPNEICSCFTDMFNKNKVDISMYKYNWSMDKDPTPNFQYKDTKIWWYKYPGRGMTINKKYTEKEFVEVYNEILNLIIKIDAKRYL